MTKREKALQRAIKELRGREVEKMGRCKDCEWASEAHDNHNPQPDIGWIYCEVNEFDIVDYFYCKKFEERSD